MPRVGGTLEQAVVEANATRPWLARYFFKRRHVLALRATSRDQPMRTPPDFELMGIGAGSPQGAESRYLEQLRSFIGTGILESRLNRRDVTLFIAVHDGSIAGFVWAVTPTTDTVWHDRVPVRPGVALLFNGYVFEQYRRRGMFTSLMVAVQDHCLAVIGSWLVLGVVEASNLASLRTLASLGYSKVGENYLIKFLGVNILSILRWLDGQRTELHVVLKSDKGRSL